MRVRVSVCLRAWECVGMCERMCLSVRAYICACMCACACVFMSAFVGVCTDQICVRAGVRTCTHACVRVPACACTCIIIQILCVGGSVQYRRPNCWTDHDQIWHAYANRWLLPGNVMNCPENQ